MPKGTTHPSNQLYRGEVTNFPEAMEVVRQQCELERIARRPGCRGNEVPTRIPQACCGSCCGCRGGVLRRTRQVGGRQHPLDRRSGTERRLLKAGDLTNRVRRGGPFLENDDE